MMFSCRAVMLLLACSGMAAAEDENAKIPIEAIEADEEIELRIADFDEPNDARWFFYLGLNQTFPKIESEDLINKLFEPLTQAIAPGFDEINTVGDLRDVGLLITPLIGVGRRIGDHFTVSMHGGWAGGYVRTEQRERILHIGPELYNDFFIYRGSWYLDFIVEAHPWGHTKLQAYDTWKERFKASRPKIALDFIFIHANYDSVVSLEVGRVLPNLRIELRDNWSIPGIRPHIGWEIPIDRHNQIVFTAGYNWFTRQRFDFEGPTFSVAWQHYWKRQSQR